MIVILGVVVIATLTTNLAANVVSPANDIANLNPRRISFKLGGYITAGLGIAIFPWKLLETADVFIFTWLVGYSVLLGPIAGVILSDYYLLRRERIDPAALYDGDGEYSFGHGWNFAGLAALVIGVLPSLPGFLKQVGAIDSIPALFQHLYHFAWLLGLVVAGVVYIALMGSKRR